MPARKVYCLLHTHTHTHTQTGEPRYSVQTVPKEKNDKTRVSHVCPTDEENASSKQNLKSEIQALKAAGASSKLNLKNASSKLNLKREIQALRLQVCKL